MKRILTGIMWLAVFCGCSRVQLIDMREGLANDNIRVYVRIDTSDIPENLTDLQLDEKLTALASERYTDLMNDFDLFYGDTEGRESIQIAISKNKKTPIKIWRKEYEKYAEAYFDFPIDKSVKKKYLEKYPDPPKKDEEDSGFVQGK